MNLTVYKITILICFLLELAMLTFWRGSLGIYFSPALLCGVSLGIGFITAGLAFNYEHFKVPSNKVSLGNWTSLILIGIALIGFYLISDKLFEIFKTWPLDKNDASSSDVIPQIIFMVERFLEGEYPYQLITAWKHHLYPTYLPLQWMPFSLAELLNIDYRWIAFASLAAAVIVFGIKIIRVELHFLIKLLLLLLPFIAWYLLIDSQEVVFSLTVEQLIAGYYLFLALAIFNHKAFLLGIAIMVCLLSRYSIVLWVPLIFWVFYFKKKEKIIWILIAMVGGFLLLYLPFLVQDASIFSKGYAYHTHATIAEWGRSSQPYHLFDGVGVAIYFFKFVEGSIEHKISMLQWAHLIASFMTIMSLGVIYFKIKYRTSSKLFLLASLKIYLVVFYTFIQMPYWYLFIVPFVISFVCLFEVWKRQTKSGEIVIN